MRQATHHSWSRSRFGLTCSMGLLLAAFVAGCGYSSPTQFVAKSTVSAVEPTATPTSGTVTPYIEVPTSTAGWQTYTDSTYRFKTVIPPGWRLGTVLDGDSTSEPECEYDVVYFPPGDTRPMEQRVWVGMHEYMLISVYLQCPPYDPQNNSRVGSVTISGVATTLYGAEDNQTVGRNATVKFGGHSYTFFLVAESDQHTPIMSDIPLYMRVLSDFVYLGGS